MDLRVGNKLETIAGESHEWKGRQKVAGFSNDEEKTVGLYGKVLSVLEINAFWRSTLRNSVPSTSRVKPSGGML